MLETPSAQTREKRVNIIPIIFHVPSTKPPSPSFIMDPILEIFKIGFLGLESKRGKIKSSVIPQSCVASIPNTSKSKRPQKLPKVLSSPKNVLPHASRFLIPERKKRVPVWQPCF